MPPTASRAKQRLSGAIMREKVAKIEDMLKVIRSEEYRLLTNFMYLSRDDLRISLDITEDGTYILNIRATTNQLIDAGITL